MDGGELGAEPRTTLRWSGQIFGRFTGTIQILPGARFDHGQQGRWRSEVSHRQ